MSRVDPLPPLPPGPRFPFLELVRAARDPAVNWPALCERAERELLPLKAHLDTWGAPCSGKREAQRERLVRLIVDCATYLQRPPPAA